MWNTQPLMDGLTMVTNTLKRFSYLHTLRRFIEPDDSDDEEFRLPYVNQLRDREYETVLCFRDFKKLEDLAIEHAALGYPWHPQDPVNFISLLPPSIKTLQLMFVYRGNLTDPLIDLAREAPVKFSHLKCVKIGIAEDIAPEDAQECNRLREVEPAFAEVGIEVQWGEDAFPAHPETLVPGGYIDPNYYPVPTNGFENIGWRDIKAI